VIYLKRKGTTYNLDDGTYCWFIGDDGVGMSDSHRLTERSPQQHGDTDVGFYLDPRVFRLYLQVEGTSRADLYDNRDTLMRLFRPGDDDLIIGYTLNDTREIVCRFYQDMKMPVSEQEGFTQKIVITLRAADPLFYNPTASAVTFTLGGGSDTMLVPTVVPMTVGASIIDALNSVNYLGSFLSYPIIRVTGPITDCVITNESTGEKLDFTGVTISGSDYREIDCRFGYKTVVDSAGANKVSDLTSDSDLSTFHIADDFEVGGGTNSIRVAGIGVTAATKIDITFFTKYIGR
jgi:hypothetical protein